VKALLTVVIAGVLLGGVFVNSAEAGDKRGKHRRVDARHYRDYDNDDYRRYRGNRYVRQRDIVVVRDYYRPYYRPVPRGVRARYYRGGYLPVGWRTRVVPVPVYYEPHFVAVPHGYRRGLIDGHVVVHNSNGFILDIAAVF
jgi:Ni/Co efflux regulator RcnB